MALWLILITTVTLSAFGVMATVDAETRATAREMVRASPMWQRLGCGAALGTVALTAGWVWHSFETGDWRYAVIGLAPFVVTAVRLAIRGELTSNRSGGDPA